MTYLGIFLIGAFVGAFVTFGTIFAAFVASERKSAKTIDKSDIK